MGCINRNLKRCLIRKGPPPDAQEKRQNKTTLRFYTAQIENKSQKRRERYSGDAEVLKERRNDRAEQLIEAARKRGLPRTSHEDDAGLDDGDPDPVVQRDGKDEEDYYDLGAAKGARKKASGNKSMKRRKPQERLSYEERGIMQE